MSLATNLADLARSFLGAPANQSATSNGYQLLPSGILIQFGSITVPASGAASGNQLVNFPTAFPTGVLQIVPSGQNVATPAKGVAWGWLANSTSDFSLRWSCTAGDLAGGTVLSYIAIGH
jgi:hypothetical protein